EYLGIAFADRGGTGQSHGTVEVRHHAVGGEAARVGLGIAGQISVVLPLYRRHRRGAHRSTSPNTMSIEPRMAETSASMWPRVRKSIACRCAKPGARILHLYGLLVPSATR